jgi:hypothetical protein
MALDVGPGAIDRTNSLLTGRTRIAAANPVNATGRVTSIELWFSNYDVNGAGVKVATFSKSGSIFTPRAVATIGVVTKGSKQTFAVSLAAETGDYIGMYSSGGELEADIAGGSGLWSAVGDYTGSATTYTEAAGYEPSIYGSGISFIIEQGEAAISAGASVTSNGDLYLGGIVPIVAAASVFAIGKGVYSGVAAFVAALGAVFDWRIPEWGTADIAVAASLAAQSLKITKGQMTTTVSASLAPLATAYLSQLFGYTGTISPGDVLVIDCDAKTIELNGTNVVRYMTGKFPQLYAGTNELRWHDDGITRTIALDEDHDPRFL